MSSQIDISHVQRNARIVNSMSLLVIVYAIAGGDLGNEITLFGSGITVEKINVLQWCILLFYWLMALRYYISIDFSWALISEIEPKRAKSHRWASKYLNSYVKYYLLSDKFNDSRFTNIVPDEIRISHIHDSSIQFRTPMFNADLNENRSAKTKRITVTLNPVANLKYHIRYWVAYLFATNDSQWFAYPTILFVAANAILIRSIFLYHTNDPVYPEIEDSADWILGILLTIPL